MFFNVIKSKLQLALIFAFVALLVINLFNLKALQQANNKIASQNQAIKALNEKIKGLDAIAQYERAQTIDAIAQYERQCAKSIKSAVAAAKIPPIPNVIFKTKTQYIEKAAPNETCQNNDPNLIIINNAYRMYDIQTAGANQ